MNLCEPSYDSTLIPINKWSSKSKCHGTATARMLIWLRTAVSVAPSTTPLYMCHQLNEPDSYLSLTEESAKLEEVYSRFLDHYTEAQAKNRPINESMYVSVRAFLCPM